MLQHHFVMELAAIMRRLVWRFFYRFQLDLLRRLQAWESAATRRTACACIPPQTSVQRTSPIKMLNQSGPYSRSPFASLRPSLGVVRASRRLRTSGYSRIMWSSRESWYGMKRSLLAFFPPSRRL